MSRRRTSDAPRRMTPKEREIDECYIRMNNPNARPEYQAYHRGKLKALQADRDTQWGHAGLMKEALKMIESDDILIRAEGCGMLYKDVLHQLVDVKTYTLKDLSKEPY